MCWTGDCARFLLGDPGGCMKRSALTSERFIASPYGAAGSRMYRTGDVARYRADGNLEFLGRADDQVKIRGFGIELGEIESALSGHASVHQAVVLAREDEPGDKRLVAYIVPVAGAEVDAAELRSHLGRSLPEYMVPSAYVELTQLPLSPNGKLDRKRLPAPEWKGREYEAPAGEIERAIAEVFMEVLKLERVGREDHFFELGGHSLLATRLISQLRQKLQVELPLRALFESPTVKGLAERVVELQPGVELPVLAAMSRPDVLPLSHAQGRLWVLEQLGLPGGAYTIPAAVRLEGVLDVSALGYALTAVVERHESLRA